MRTGHSIDSPLTYPAFPCVLAKELGESRANVPCYIAVGSAPPVASAAFKAGFLGPRYEPVTVRPVRGFGPDSIALPPADVFDRQAKGKGEELRKSVAKAFDLSAETQEVRAAYGPDPFGQAACSPAALSKPACRSWKCTWTAGIRTRTTSRSFKSAA